MKSIKLTTGEFLFVEVPDNAYEFIAQNRLNTTILYKDSDGEQIIRLGDTFNVEIISTTKDITEEQTSEIVENDSHFNDDKFPNYKEYGEITWATFPYESALESLRSLLKNLGLNPNKNYLILKKNG